MSRFLKIALFSTIAFTGAACGKKGGSAMWDKMGAYADKVCGCKDMDCITKAGEQWAKDAEIAKESGGKAAEMSADDKKKSEEITKKITDCTKKVTDEMMKKAGGGGDTTKKDDTKKDDTKKDDTKADDTKKDDTKKDDTAKKDDTKKDEDPEITKKAMEVMTKVADIMVADAKDCKKMGAELTKLVADNKATIDAMNEWEKKEPAAKKAWEEKHKADMEAWAKKVEAPFKACEKDKEVAAVWKKLSE